MLGSQHAVLHRGGSDEQECQPSRQLGLESIYAARARGLSAPWRNGPLTRAATPPRFCARHRDAAEPDAAKNRPPLSVGSLGGGKKGKARLRVHLGVAVGDREDRGRRSDEEAGLPNCPPPAATTRSH